MVAPSSGVNRKARRRRCPHMVIPARILQSEPMSDQSRKPDQRTAAPRQHRFKPDKRERQERRLQAEAERSDEDVIVLYGWHPVVEALRNEHRGVRRLLATENSASRLHEAVPELRIQPELVRPHDISRLLEPDAVHQG